MKEREGRGVETVLRERCKRALDDVPDLVIIVIGALPHLDSSPRINIPIGQIQALMHVRPRDPIVTSNCKLLVGVPSEAGVDLHLDTVGSGAIGHVKALISENLDRPTSNIPRLRSRPITFLDCNSRVIGVTRGGQTFARRGTGLNLFSLSRGRGAGRGEGPSLVCVAIAVPDLDSAPRSKLSIRIIQTFVRSSKSNTPIASRGPLLVRIPASTSPNLHLLTVRLDTIRIVEAFITEDLEGSRRNGPELGGGGSGGAARTVLDDDCGAIGV